MRYHILERDKFRCRTCGSAPSHTRYLRIDHYNPHSETGEYLDPDNLWTLCQQCNSGKRDDEPTPAWVPLIVRHGERAYEVMFRDIGDEPVAHPDYDYMIDALVEGDVVEV